MLVELLLPAGTGRGGQRRHAVSGGAAVHTARGWCENCKQTDECIYGNSTMRAKKNYDEGEKNYGNIDECLEDLR